MATRESPQTTWRRVQILPFERHFYNLSMTYRVDSDIYFGYARIIDKSTGKIIAPSSSVVWKEPDNNYKNDTILKIVQNKSKTAAWSASRCRTRSHRTSLVIEIQRDVDVDVYGECGKLKCDLDSFKCTDYEKTYRFYLAFENSLCVDYVSEKVFKVMDQIVIPIVYNGADMKRILPPKSYIDVDDFKSVKELTNYMKFLSENPDEYVKYFWWKEHYEVVGMNSLCEICKGLHEHKPTKSKNVTSVIRQFFNKNDCERHIKYKY